MIQSILFQSSQQGKKENCILLISMIDYGSTLPLSREDERSMKLRAEASWFKHLAKKNSTSTRACR